MRTSFILPLFLLALTAASQPEFDRNYCGFAPNDSIDITNDGIPDLVVQGFRNGTDDEPSSSGNCYLQLMNLPGTTLLNSRDEQGRWRLKVCSKGDRIRAMLTRPQDDLRFPLENYTDGSIPLAHWGYGGNAEQFTTTPNHNDQFYVFRTVANGRTRHGSFTIDAPVWIDQVKVRVGTIVPTDRSFVVP